MRKRDNKKIIIICIEGYSASLRADSKTLSAPFKTVMNEVGDKADIELYQFHSSEPGVVKKATKCLLAEKPGDVLGLYLIGKSLGGVKAYRVYKRAFKKLKDYRRVSLVFVDAHSPFPTFYGPYRMLRINKKHPNTRVFNVYQRNCYPRGAVVKGADENIKLKSGVDHWNIIFQEETKSLYQKGLEWVLTDWAVPELDPSFLKLNSGIALGAAVGPTKYKGWHDEPDPSYH